MSSCCPRLAYLEWVQGEWAESGDTVEGRQAHRRVDRREGSPLPEPSAEEEADEAGERLATRSVTLSSRRLGLIAKLDLVETEGGTAVPVDYKRGRRPHVAAGAYEPERIQLCVQALLLEEHGYKCEEGVLYFAASRERVRVAFDVELRARAVEAMHGLRLMAAGGRMPPPLNDSPKCPRCSLVGICLPDEVNWFRRAGAALPRPILVRREEALPLYVQAYNARIAKKGETLEISEEDGPKTSARLIDISQVVLMGNVSVTTPCLHELMSREIPVTWHSYGGWFIGHTAGTGHKNVELRTAQYRASFDETICLRLARSLVEAKIRNARTLLRRNWRADADARQAALDPLKRLAERVPYASGMDTLLGLEGEAAAIYFRNFSSLLKPGSGEALPPAEAQGMEEEENEEEEDEEDETGEMAAGGGSCHGGETPPANAPENSAATAPVPAGNNAFAAFRFEQRNRRPPADPVNAMLSFAYAMLARTLTVTLSGAGFDVYRGFYHQPRYGRPALALDLMEPYRPIVADSIVIQAINNGEVKPSDFVYGAGGCALKPPGRKRFIAAFERRLSQETTHPLFGYQLSLRRLIDVQARLLGRYLLGEIKEYPHYMPR